ncbi:hypothetical protein [Streptococcus pneumoniae]|uniref:hypothetical protein n=1 Tax=Streptococcus pneumoniae TaxID=1313 RepID=UPI0015DA4E66|nr:hypothetical protein [Streptococcus pneumoniae]
MTEKVRTVSLSKSVLFEGRNRIGCSKHSFEVAGLTWFEEIFEEWFEEIFEEYDNIHL